MIRNTFGHYVVSEERRERLPKKKSTQSTYLGEGVASGHFHHQDGRSRKLEGMQPKCQYFTRTTRGFLKALETRGTFFASTRKGAKPGNQPPQVHFHKKDCPKWKLTRRGQNPNPYTSIRIKVTTTSVAALYQWMQEQYPERFSHRHVCTWCNISTFMRRRIGAERLCMTKRAAIMSRRPRGSYIGGHTVIKLGKSRPEPKQRPRDQSAVDAPNKPKPPPSKKYWALRILRLVKIHAITQDHPEAQKAIDIIGTARAMEIVSGGPRSSRRPQSIGSDALNKRLPGSFETGKRR